MNKIKKSAPIAVNAKTLSVKLMSEIEAAIHTVRPFGSVEIYVQNNTVTQITARNIKKTNVGLA